MDPRAIGEATIPQSVISQVAPDVASPQGQQQLFQKAVGANQTKPIFDSLLKKIATSLGATTSSRIKNIETAAAKVAQKRLQGRRYDSGDINDILGARIVLKSKKDLSKAKDAIDSLEDKGILSIDKQEPVKNDTYSAYHIDGKFNNTPVEIQIMDKKEEAESLINHSLRALYGEKPENKDVKKLRDAQANIVKKLPDSKLSAVSEAMKSLGKQVKGQPLGPHITARVLSSVQ